jgi:phage gpG-like protein
MRPQVEVKGGNRINQRMQSFKQRLQNPNGVKVGVPSGAGSYDDGTKIATIAATHEFGGGNVPERSFLRVPLRANKKTYAKIIRNGVQDALAGQSSMVQVMNQVGARAAGDSQKAISKGIAPPNAESTVEQKGSSTPLVDTGRLRQSITWVLEGEQ